MTKNCPYCLTPLKLRIYCDSYHQRIHEKKIAKFDIRELKSSFIGESVSEVI